MKRTRYLVLCLLGVTCFSLAVVLQPRSATWSERAQSGGALKMLLGDSRRLFASQFFVMADVSFHSGYYPTIFDRREPAGESPMITGHDEHDHHAEGADEHDEHDGDEDHHDAAEEQHEKDMSFLGKPRDWIEAFGRNFFVTEHTHLHGGKEREILPWLKLSAEMDPERADTYVVAAYWLRERLGRVQEAEDFLRDGLRNIPNNPEILFELGRFNHENQHDNVHARNIWELALRRWNETDGQSQEPNYFLFEKIVLNLARLDEEMGNYDRALQYMELCKQHSPNPAAIQKQIDEIKAKQAAAAPPSSK